MTERTLAASGSRFAIASPHHLASEAGRRAFEKGGNAIDAALAAAAALTVVYPHNCAIGGDVIALVAQANGHIVTVNGSGAAARAVSADELRGGSMPIAGPHTVTVPGAVRAWETIAELGAELSLSELLADAIAFADQGVPVASSLAAAIERLADELARDEGMAAIFLGQGRPLSEGELFRQPALAQTLQAIADEGVGVLYGGFVGSRLIDRLRSLGSHLTIDDLSAHSTELAAPLAGSFGERQILTAPPNSQGFVLLEMLAALERLGIDLDPHGESAGLIAEVFRLATADRDRFLADPSFSETPLDRLLSPEHASDLADAVRSRAPAAFAPVTSGRPAGDTVAVVTADSDGNAVSLIQSIFAQFGAGILDPATGIVCHNRGASFSLRRESPNVLEGGKRPAHTLMPVMVRHHGQIESVNGTMGGRAQPQIHAHLLLHLRAGADAAAMGRAARWVVGAPEVGGANDVVLVERGVGATAMAALKRDGVEVRELPDNDAQVGHAQVVRVTSGALSAATDPRCDGSAVAI